MPIVPTVLVVNTNYRSGTAAVAREVLAWFLIARYPRVERETARAVVRTFTDERSTRRGE